MPIARGTGALTHFCLAATVLGVIQRHIVLERFGACQVVIVALLQTPYDATRLILQPCERLELHLDVTLAHTINGCFSYGKIGQPKSLFYCQTATQYSHGFSV